MRAHTGCTPTPPPPVTAPARPSTPLPTVIANVTPVAASPCHYRFAANGAFLPDLNCTPGEGEPDITDDTVLQTFCIAGWMDQYRPRPATAVTNRLKYQSIVDYGWAADLTQAQAMAGGFEEDHLDAHEIGGLSGVHLASNGRPTNLWAEPDNSPNAKDKVEGAAHDAICGEGEITRSYALQAMADDWTALAARLGVKL
jgi:hypothetical protein